MSRRKQSKPRAVLKHGTTDEDNLLDPKDEILTDIESDEDDQNFDDDTNIEMETTIQNDNKNNDEIEKLIDKPQNFFKHHSEINEETQLEEPPPEKDEINLDNFGEEIYDDIREIDNEDANSSDSFYSDLYSTHTSSSYSPSMSEGAATPNSLLHQSQHLLYPTVNNLEVGENDDDNNRLRSNHNNNNHNLTNNKNLPRRRQLCRKSSTGNEIGVDDINEDEYEVDGSNNGADDNHDENDDGIDSGNERVINDSNIKEPIGKNDKRIIINRNSENVGNRKSTTKLRKIDRGESTGNNKSTNPSKMTGNGIDGSGTIKNGTTTSDGSYQCQFCDKSFPRLGYLKKHEQSHAEHLPFKCDYCARLFKHKRSRDRHTKLHTGDRRYRCPHCEAAFSRSDHLKIHMKTHDNQKPFQCTVCNRGYNTAAALTSHMQNHKKQAALLGTGLQPLNYSPRSTGSGSSNGSYNTKRRYATVPLAVLAATTAAAAGVDNNNSPTNHIGGGGNDYNKRQRSTFISCVYCTKSDFTTLDQLNNHIQAMHENVLSTKTNKDSPKHQHSLTIPNFQLNCEYCTMKFPNIPTMFQHMRATHIDRMSSPNSYFENFNRLAASGTFSPRLLTATPKNRFDDNGGGGSLTIKREEISPNNLIMDKNDNLVNEKDDEQVGPTDLSQPKKRVQTPFDRNTTTPSTGPISTELLEKHHQQQQQQVGAGAFLCNQCNAALPDFETFRNHLKSHIQGMNLVCQHCGLTLRDQNEYERHTISHFLITNTEFSCSSSCQKIYSKTEDLQKHLYEAHVQIMYKCSLCSDLFDTKVAIQVHFACAHSNESKIFRCSACMEQLRTEKEFTIHVKTRHQTVSGTIQCMFCRAVCSSELEMHFHLAAHARQFRCPSCPETFHVEFLLDRHMQTHHNTGVNNQKDCHPPSVSPALAVNGPNQLFLNAAAQYAKQQQNNNNNNILDYHAFAASAAVAAGKGIFQMTTNSVNGGAGATSGTKFYSALQVDTNSVKHPSLIYGLGQRYFDAGKSLLDTMYNYQQEKSAAAAAAAAESAGRSYFVSPRSATGLENNNNNNSNNNNLKESVKRSHPENNKITERNIQNGFSCGICERNDFRTETEVHSHRKIVHNLKTGVSTQCAYCSGNFKSRSELEHHMKTSHNSTGKHKCLICDEIFLSPTNLAEHKLQKHPIVGQSGKCSHCSIALNDVSAFKSHLSEHNVEGQIQCICCRQTLNSDFEIGLHAKFHTKSSGAPENACALCLEALPITSDTKVCEKCCRKHNLTTKFTNMRFDNHSHKTNNSFVENRCNLCKMILPHAQRLQEHLVEHTFVGCEERGYSCYICSAVFTIPAGLLAHMSSEHGQNARPYDCNLCTEKFFFRAELDNHLIEHENKGPVAVHLDHQKYENREKRNDTAIPKDEKPKEIVPEQVVELKAEIKMETVEEPENDDEEYIEVEKVVEPVENDSEKIE